MLNLEPGAWPVFSEVLYQVSRPGQRAPRPGQRGSILKHTGKAGQFMAVLALAMGGLLVFRGVLRPLLSGLSSDSRFRVTSNGPFFQTSLGPTTTITLLPGQDNTLFEHADGQLSNGAGERFFAGRTGQSEGSIRRGLIKFVLADHLPPGAIVVSASLTLNLVSVSDSLSQTMTLHALQTDWGESESDAPGGQGILAFPGDATWSHAITPTHRWVAPGGDFASAASAETVVKGGAEALGVYEWGSTPQTVADVQRWLDNPATNFGWLLQGNEDQAGSSRSFASRENTVEAKRPRLTITYRPSHRVFLPWLEIILWQLIFKLISVII